MTFVTNSYWVKFVVFCDRPLAAAKKPDFLPVTG
jgi:hypothetical protein